MFTEMDLRLAAMLVAALYFSTAAGMLLITQKEKSALLWHKNGCKKTDASSSEHTYTYIC